MFGSVRGVSRLLKNVYSLQWSAPVTFSPCCFKFCSSTSSQSLPIDYESISKGDASTLKKLKIIELEVDVMRQEGLKVPSKISTVQWTELLALKSRSQRLKQLSFWWLNEIKRANDKKKKEEKRLKRLEEVKVLKEQDDKSDHIKYGFAGSTIFLRVYPNKIDSFHNSKLVRAMMFGQSLVLDCSYDQYMTPKEASNCAKQLQLLFSDNRNNDDPFNIHFCNAQRDSKVIQKLEHGMPTLYDDAFPANMTEKSYLEIFPKERLVYLTPHCRQELLEYSHDDVYIIGAMVDKVNTDPLSMGKAKSEGLRMARLPLDRYLTWCIGSKSLTLNQVLNILLTMKSTGDWNKALEHVPKRKLYDPRQNEEWDPLKRERRRLYNRKQRKEFDLRFKL